MIQNFIHPAKKNAHFPYFFHCHKCVIIVLLSWLFSWIQQKSKLLKKQEKNISDLSINMVVINTCYGKVPPSAKSYTENK